MKRRTVSIVLLLSLAFNVAFMGAWIYRYFSGPHRSGRGWSRDRRSPWDQIELTEVQQERIDRMRKELHEKMRRLRQDIMEERRVLAEEFEAENPDSVKIAKRLQIISEKELAAEKEVVRYMLQQREILTPEQREPFMNFIKRRMGVRPPDQPGGRNSTKKRESWERKSNNPTNQERR
jgi:Spy/CpxP family protein refolding chaperone